MVFQKSREFLAFSSKIPNKNISARQSFSAIRSPHLIPELCRLADFFENGIDSGEKFAIIYIDINKTEEKMKLIERTNSSPEDDKVILEYFEFTQEFSDIKDFIQDNGQLFAVFDKGKNMLKLKIKDILYFEAVGELVFAYTEKGVFEVKMRLYQVEEALERHKILRASKSFLINLYRISAVTPALNGRLIATMDNGEKVMISRQYAKAIAEQFVKGLV